MDIKECLYIPQKILREITFLPFLFKALGYAKKTIIGGDRAKFTEKTEREILLLGNGPSLNQISLIDLISSNRDFACVNDFAIKSELFDVIRPKYYIIIDPYYFDSSVNNINIRMLYEKLNSVDWGMTIVLPQHASVCFDNPLINYEYISTAEINSYDARKQRILNELYRNNLASCGLQNVLCGALHYFILKRFPKIYIAGCDMNEFLAYSIDHRNHVILKIQHFYGESMVDCTEQEYAAIPKGMFHKWLGYYATMLEQFYHLSAFAEFQNVKVYNLTENSYIDCFEKIDWHSLITT